MLRRTLSSHWRMYMALLCILGFVALGGVVFAFAYADRSSDRCREQFGPEADYWGPGKCRLPAPVLELQD